MPGSRPYYVYVMTNRFHTTLFMGMTPDLRRRVILHKLSASACFYHPRGHSKLIYYETLRFAYEALQRERALKGMPRRLLHGLIASNNPQWRDLALDLDLASVARGRADERW